MSAEEMTWRPIETAPKDGTKFVAGFWGEEWLPATDEGLVATWISVIAWLDDRGDIDVDCGVTGWEIEDFTHWMPLPPPPVSSS